MNKVVANVSGGVGLLLLATAVFSVFVSPLSVVVVKVVLGLAGIVYWAMNRTTDSTAATRFAVFYGSSGITTVAVIAALVGLNYIVSRRNQTWDLTDKKIFSLAPKTLTVLKELKEPVKAIVFFPGDTPPQLEDLFNRYAGQTDKFTWEVKDPKKEPQLVDRYKIKEQQAAAVLVKSPGAAGESHTTTNLQAMLQTAYGEQELTNGLVRLFKVGEQKVYFVTGHGELSLEAEPGSLGSTLKTLKDVLVGEGYSADSLNLTQAESVPRDAAVLVVAAPKDDFSEEERARLSAYLDEGGRLLYFVGDQKDGALNPVLSRYGIAVDPGVVIDPKAILSRSNPLFIGVLSYGDHELVKPLKDQKLVMRMLTARGLSRISEGLAEGATSTTLMTTTPAAWLETNLESSSGAVALDSGEKSGSLPLALVATRNTAQASNKRFDETRIVAVGDQALLTDLLALEGNINFVLNAFAWASQQPEKITIQPPSRDVSTLDVTQETFDGIRLVVLDILPVVLLGLGLAIWRVRGSR